MSHLWAGAPLPVEYLQLVLCRDIYHCPPSMLPDWVTIRRAMAMIDAEQKVAQRKRGK